MKMYEFPKFFRKKTKKNLRSYLNRNRARKKKEKEKTDCTGTNSKDHQL